MFKIIVESGPPKTKTFSECSALIALDSSGSTGGFIWQKELELLKSFSGVSRIVHGVSWSGSCSNVSLIDHKKSMKKQVEYLGRGTHPSVLLESTNVLSRIRQSDYWCISTDGCISNLGVENFASQISRFGIGHKPFILFVYEQELCWTSNINPLSVGIACWASSSNGLLVSVSSKGLCTIVDRKGHFDMDISCESNCEPHQLLQKMADIQIPEEDKSPGYLIPGLWNTRFPSTKVDVEVLISTADIEITEDELDALLDEESFHAIALLCKTKGIISSLFSWLKKLACKYQGRPIPPFKDQHGAFEFYVRLLQTSDEQARIDLSRSLKEAHRRNQQSYQIQIQSTSIEQARQEMANKIQACLSKCTLMEQSNYSEDILYRKSNRARRAEKIDSSAASPVIPFVDIYNPDLKASRGKCDVCYDDDAIMCFALKTVERVEDNTSDFALNYPLALGPASQNKDLLSAQRVCYQCARALSNTIYREKVAAIVPIIDYKGTNKLVINEALTKALTGGLKTGVSGIAQSFLSLLLHHLLQDTEWINREHAEWFVENLLHQIPCRRDFTEMGDWVNLERALEWAVHFDYQKSTYKSWLCRYPMQGYNIILQCCSRLNLSVPIQATYWQWIRRCITLFTNHVHKDNNTSAPYSNKMYHPWMSVLYKNFQEPGVPCNHSGIDDDTNAVNDLDVFISHLRCIDPGLNTPMEGKLSPDLQITHKHRRILQTVIYYLIQYYNNPMSVEAVITQLLSNQDIGTQLTYLLELDETASGEDEKAEKIVTSLLEKPFLPSKLIEAIVPFTSPYGASVLYGQDREKHDFTIDLTEKEREILNRLHETYFEPENEDSIWDLYISLTNKVYSSRDTYLKKIYWIGRPGPESNVKHDWRGLPMSPMRQDQFAIPVVKCFHYNLHASVIKVWMTLEPEDRRKLNRLLGQDEEFIQKVVHHIVSNDKRGNIYERRIKDEIKDVIPSFMKEIARYIEKQNRKQATVEDIINFQHSDKDKTMIRKIAYEWTPL